MSAVTMSGRPEIGRHFGGKSGGMIDPQKKTAPRALSRRRSNRKEQGYANCTPTEIDQANAFYLGQPAEPSTSSDGALRRVSSSEAHPSRSAQATPLPQEADSSSRNGAAINILEPRGSDCEHPHHDSCVETISGEGRRFAR